MLVAKATEAQKFVWEGAIPLQIHLHESEVTTLPPPATALILAPRIGYLPLLVPQIKPFFSNALPPGVDTVWFEYKGLPLKWYIPTGVLFDLLCAEPERPWNLTVHFRGYPGNILTPCEGEDSVKWSFINSLKEAAYIINGNCKNVMNMSQSDQVELWRSVLNSNMESYINISSKLKLSIVGDDVALQSSSASEKSQESPDGDVVLPIKTGRVPVRLYVRIIDVDIDDLEDLPVLDSWEKVSYINRPVEIQLDGKCFTLYDAVKAVLPEFFIDKSEATRSSLEAGSESGHKPSSGDESEETLSNPQEHCFPLDSAVIKLLRIQGIEPKLEIPFSWVVNNLMNPEHFLHICVYIKVLQPINL